MDTNMSVELHGEATIALFRIFARFATKFGVVNAQNHPQFTDFYFYNVSYKNNFSLCLMH